MFYDRRRSVFLLLILLVILCFQGCSNDKDDVSKVEKQNKQIVVNEDILEDNQTDQMEQQPSETAPECSKPISTPEFFNDIGKTLNKLKKEYPGAEIFTRNNGLPDAAAICFGEQEGKYSYYFFGTQDGDFKKVMDGYGDQLKCAGSLTTADVLFPQMGDDMPFSDFFSLIGVSDYEYGSEEDAGQGWLNFKYENMDVWLNTNEINTSGGWEFTGVERVKRSAQVAIFDEEIDNQNYELANEVMFEQ